MSLLSPRRALLFLGVAVALAGCGDGDSAADGAGGAAAPAATSADGASGAGGASGSAGEADRSGDGAGAGGAAGSGATGDSGNKKDATPEDAGVSDAVASASTTPGSSGTKAKPVGKLPPPDQQAASLVAVQLSATFPGWLAYIGAQASTAPRLSWTTEKKGEKRWEATVTITAGSEKPRTATWEIGLPLDRIPTDKEISSTATVVTPLDAQARRFGQQPPKG